jgi:hypothetical protein
LFAIACLGGCGNLGRTNQPAASTGRASITDLPQPRPQPVTRTSAAAQVAWIWLSTGQSSSLLAFDSTGRQVGRLASGAAPPGPYGLWRSPDGSLIFGADAESMTAYSALNGNVVRTYPRTPGDIVGDAFSPDGRYLALLLFDIGRLQLEAIDTVSGRLLGPVPVAHAPDAPMPGMQGPPSAWATAAFAPDSLRLYTLSDWGAQPRISAFSVAGASLRQLGTTPVTVDDCGGPATSIKVVDGGDGIAAFCHFSGAVWLLDSRTLGMVTVLHPVQSNPFAASPLFTPDGLILYVMEGQRIQAIDLHRQMLLGPAQISMSVGRGVLSLIASLFARDAEAGWVASTVPIAPDGLKLYLAGSDGIMVLRIPDLKVIGRLAPGMKAGEIWVSGDGRTLFATTDDGHRLGVINADGSGARSISLPSMAGGFLSSEHG